MWTVEGFIIYGLERIFIFFGWFILKLKGYEGSEVLFRPKQDFDLVPERVFTMTYSDGHGGYLGYDKEDYDIDDYVIYEKATAMTTMIHDESKFKFTHS